MCWKGRRYITPMNLHRLPGENERQYIWRLASAKDSGTLDLSWPELTEIFNAELRDDESTYNESAYRKPYQMAKAYYEDVFSKLSEDDYTRQLAKHKLDLELEKQALRDERYELLRLRRNESRMRSKIEDMWRCIAEGGKQDYRLHVAPHISGDSDLLVCLSDLHYGAEYSSAFGNYNPELARQRLGEYLSRVLEIRRTHQSEGCYVCLLGDMISGNIHKSIAITNRENVVRQVQQCSELVAQFCFELCKAFSSVTLLSVNGNHSRLDRKEDALKDERLDEFIPWYVAAKLSHIENFAVKASKPDSSICDVDIRGKEYIACHGDFDPMTKQGVANLVMLLGYKPYAILRGHSHVCATNEIGGVQVVQSGCLGGSGDDFTVQKRLTGTASQMVCVCDESGIVASYRVGL